MKLIILDNGHGQETKGKRSPVWPDGTQLLEWEYNRKVVDAVYGRLMAADISCVKLVPEKTDTPLSERVRRANGIAAMNSISQVLLVSVHVNASPMPGSASGWEIHTSPGQTKSDEYAQYFWDAASRLIGGRFPIRGDWEDGEGDRDSGLYLLKRTACPAVLTENLFMDNPGDCRFLLSEEGFSKIVDIHTEAIRKIWSLQ